MGFQNRDRSGSGASGFLAPPFSAGGNKRYSGSSPSSVSSMTSTPFASPVPVDLKQFASSPGVPVHSEDHSATDSKRSSLNMGKASPTANMEFSRDTPPEMVPVLTLLTCQHSREYIEGYFMILSDLNTGKLWFESNEA
jgi:hypothetical protein